MTSARTRNGFARSYGPPNTSPGEAFVRASTRHIQSRELWFASSDAEETSADEKLSDWSPVLDAAIRRYEPQGSEMLLTS